MVNGSTVIIVFTFKRYQAERKEMMARKILIRQLPQLSDALRNCIVIQTNDFQSTKFANNFPNAGLQV